MILKGAILGWMILKAVALISDSYCIDYYNYVFVSGTTVVPYDAVTRRHGSVDCLAGDIVLIGTYINLGELGADCLNYAIDCFCKCLTDNRDPR